MKQYRILVDYGSKGYTLKGNIFTAMFECWKRINSGAFVKILKWE